MIKISNSNGIFSKFKKFFCGNSYEVEKNISDDSSNNETPKKNFNNFSNKDILRTADNSSNEIQDVKPDDFSVKSISNVDDNNISIKDQSQTYDNTNVCPVNLFRKDDEIPCFEILGSNGNYYTTGKRKILFKVDKNKFEYPISKVTKLFYYPNLPVIESLENTKTILTKNSTTTIICNGAPVEVPISIDYSQVKFKPYINYSVLLYNEKPINPNPGDCTLDINNLDVYALENDSLFLNSFEMCFPEDVPEFDPSQFLVEIKVVDPTTDFVTPVCEFEDYYLYQLTVDIKLSLSPGVDISFINIDTLNVLNDKLQKTSNNTTFTKLELDSISSIDFSGVTNLDYNIFKYLLKLVTLDISNTNAQTNANFSELNNLSKLENLVAKDNDFSDLSIFLTLTNLVNSLKTLDISNSNTKLFRGGLLDIAPLAMFSNLTILNISGNTITNLDKLSTLTSLIEFNASNCGLNNNSFSNLIFSSTLENLDISYNSISDLSVLDTVIINWDTIKLTCTNQTINYGTLYMSSSNDFSLDLDFLIDIDLSTPCIDFISNNGECYTGESCDCKSAVWSGITTITNVYLDFSNVDGNFSGRVNLILDPSVAPL